MPNRSSATEGAHKLAKPLTRFKRLVTLVVLLMSEGAMSGGPVPPASGPRFADAPIGFRVRLGHNSLESTTTLAAFRAALEVWNTSNRVVDLPDSLNPDIIDVDKAFALIVALPAIAAQSPQLMARHVLFLNHGPLRIGATDPTAAADFARPFKLEADDIQGETLLAKSTVPTVARLARANAVSSKARLLIEHAKIITLEKRLEAASDSIAAQRAILADLTPALWRRSALARVWWSNAVALSQSHGAGAESLADADAAVKALNTYLLPSGPGMAE